MINSQHEAQIALHSVSKFHQRANIVTEIFDAIDLSIQSGEFVCIMGPSGSGKTTLLNLIGGLDRPSSGSVKIDGIDISQLNKRQLADWRSLSMGYIFQFYNLIPVLSASQNVSLPLSLQGIPAKQRQQRVAMALDMVSLSHRENHYPAELSGGEQQRVAIARAIVTNPKILLCDEPTGDLDSSTGKSIMELLSLLNKEFGKTIIVVTHDPKITSFADRVITLEMGKIVESSPSFNITNKVSNA